MACVEEYMDSIFLQIYVFKKKTSRILQMVSKNVMNISDDLSYITVPFKKNERFFLRL